MNYWPDTIGYYFFKQFPEMDFETIIAPYVAKRDVDKAAFLKIVCNGGNPAPEVWSPLPETCEGFVEAAQ